MRQHKFLTAALIALAPLACGPLGAQQVEDDVAGDEVRQAPAEPDGSAPVLIHMVRRGPADELGATLERVLGGRDFAVAADASNSVLFIHCNEKTRPRVAKLLSVLDRPAALVRVEVLLLRGEGVRKLGGTSGEDPAVSLDKLMEDGEVSISDRVVLTTLDGVQGLAQFGQQRARTIGGFSRGSDRSGFTRASQMTNFGTLLTVTPTVSADGIQLEVSFEKSDLLHAPSGGDDQQGGPTPDSIGTTTLQTTVQIRSGQAVLLGGLQQQGEPSAQQALILRAHVLGNRGQSPEAKPASESP